MFGTKSMKAGDMTQMKVKTGYNQIEKKFYIQITDRKTLDTMRVYMEPEFFKAFVYNMTKTQQFSS